MKLRKGSATRGLALKSRGATIEQRDEAFLLDIKTACFTIAERLRHRQFLDLVENGEFCDGIVRQLTIIGEASNNLSEKTQRQYPEIDWVATVDLRNVRAHEYWTPDLPLIWNTATLEVPKLLSLLSCK